MPDRPILSSVPPVATPEMVEAALDLVWEDSKDYDELVRNIWQAMATEYLSAQQFVDCACTNFQQDETCPVGYPSLPCEICDGKGVVPYVKLDGPELWEIVFGIAHEVAHEITGEQYTKIAEAINSVFIEPAPSLRAQALEEAAKLLESLADAPLDGPAHDTWERGRRYAYRDGAMAIRKRALSSQPVTDGWLPIETAPKDGTVIDLWSSEFGRQPDCFWGKREHHCGEAGQYCDSDWHSEPEAWMDSSQNTQTFDDVTHWRPLPASPGAWNE